MSFPSICTSINDIPVDMEGPHIDEYIVNRQKLQPKNIEVVIVITRWGTYFDINFSTAVYRRPVETV